MPNNEAAKNLGDITNQEYEKVKNKGLLSKAGSFLFHSGLGGAVTYVGYKLVGFGSPLTGLGFAAGSLILNLFKKNPDKKSKGLTGLIRDYTAGTTAGIVGVGVYDYAAKYIPNPDLIGKLKRAAAGVFIGNPIFTAAYLGADKLIKYGPIKMWYEFGKNYWTVLKNATLYLGWLVGLTINGYLFGYPGIVAGDVGYRIVAGLSQRPAVVQPQVKPDAKPAASYPTIPYSGVSARPS